MGIQRIRTVQAHAVPDRAYYPGANIFDPGVTAAPVITRSDYMPDPPPGATCLNGMLGVELFTCEVCGAEVAESEFDGHLC